MGGAESGRDHEGEGLRVETKWTSYNNVLFSIQISVLWFFGADHCEHVHPLHHCKVSSLLMPTI